MDSLFTDIPVLNAKFLTNSVTTLDQIENYGRIVRELEELARKKIEEKKEVEALFLLVKILQTLTFILRNIPKLSNQAILAYKKKIIHT